LEVADLHEEMDVLHLEVLHLHEEVGWLHLEIVNLHEEMRRCPRGGRGRLRGDETTSTRRS